MSSEVDPHLKHNMLQSDKKFQTFKHKLTQKYILPFKDERPCLANPLEKYSHIEQADWNAFVHSKLSDKFVVSILHTLVETLTYVMV